MKKYCCEPQIITSTICLKSVQFSNLCHWVILYHEWFTIELQLIIRQHTNGNHFEQDVVRIIQCSILYNISLENWKTEKCVDRRLVSEHRLKNKFILTDKEQWCLFRELLVNNCYTRAYNKTSAPCFPCPWQLFFILVWNNIETLSKQETSDAHNETAAEQIVS